MLLAICLIVKRGVKDSSSEENNYKEEREDRDEVDCKVSCNPETFLIFSDILWLDLLQ